MNFSEHPELVGWPEMHYVFAERVGPFMENAGAAWQQAHPLVPALMENNKITGYMALYKMGPKIYRAGFSLAAPPVKLPEGLKYEKIHGENTCALCSPGRTIIFLRHRVAPGPLSAKRKSKCVTILRSRITLTILA